MDQLSQINQILDSCLTTDNLNQVYSPEKRLGDINTPATDLFIKHQCVQVEFLEKVGSQVESGIQAPLQGWALIHVCRRLDSFLQSEGFVIRPTF